MTHWLLFVKDERGVWIHTAIAPTEAEIVALIPKGCEVEYFEVKRRQERDMVEIKKERAG